MFHVKHNVSYYEFSHYEDTVVLFERNKEVLNKYIDQLLWWNNKVNLVSRNVSRETIKEHIIHSLTIHYSKLFRGSAVVLDAGSGGGLPGIPLAISNSNKQVILNDIVSKKMIACKQIVRTLDLSNCEVHSGSVGEMFLNGQEQIITKHAFKVNQLVALLEGKEWSEVIMLKGLKETETELEWVEEELNINIYSLEQENNSFYDGKALVEIKRKNL